MIFIGQVGEGIFYEDLSELERQLESLRTFERCLITGFRNGTSAKLEGLAIRLKHSPV